MKDNGDSAFPYQGYDYDSQGEMKLRYSVSGMSLRDYFAGQVIIGLAMSGNTEKTKAQTAYEIADAMIEERGKP